MIKDNVSSSLIRWVTATARTYKLKLPSSCSPSEVHAELFPRLLYFPPVLLIHFHPRRLDSKLPNTHGGYVYIFGLLQSGTCSRVTGSGRRQLGLSRWLVVVSLFFICGACCCWFHLWMWFYLLIPENYSRSNRIGCRSADDVREGISSVVFHFGRISVGGKLFLELSVIGSAGLGLGPPGVGGSGYYPFIDASV